MMKKRIAILGLTLLFLVSTTGLPVTYHLCKMMEQKSLSECETCKAEIEIIVSTCCTEETVQYPITISPKNPVCCRDEFVYNKVSDDFIYNKSEINLYSSSNNLSQPIISFLPKANFSNVTSFYFDSSPPFLINSELHISNSVFLI